MSVRKVARREFLKATSAGAIGLTAAALNPKRLFGAPRGDRGVLPLLSIGYTPSTPESGERVRLTAADRALVGDPTFISRGARVTIRSFSRALRHQGLPGGAAIDVVHPAIGYAPQRYPRFRAWSYSTDNDLDNVSGPIGFAVPITATHGLQFLVRRVTADTDGPAIETFALTLGSEYGTMKLQRGVYVIAFRESAGDSVPAWSALSLSSNGGQLIVNTTAFSYAVMTIDYAE